MEPLDFARIAALLISGVLLGGISGLVGGGIGGWLNGYFDPLFRAIKPEPGVRLHTAWTGLNFGRQIGMGAGFLCGAAAALLSGLISPLILAALGAIAFRYWVRLLYRESVIGSPGAPLAGAVCGVAGGYAGRVLILHYLEPLMTGA